MATTKKSANSAELTDYRRLLVQTAIELVAVQLAALNPDAGKLPLDHPSYDDLFNAALRRAEKLFTSPLLDECIVYAEQLFEPHEILSENQIGLRFEKKWNWPDLSSRGPLLDLMKDIASWYVWKSEKIDKELEQAFGTAGLEEKRFLEALFEFCGKATGRVKFGQWSWKVERLAGRIVDLVEVELNQPRSTEGNLGGQARDAALEYELITLAFADRRPAERNTESPGMQRNYRPHALFRYLRQRGGDDPAGKALNARLAIARSLLKEGPQPFELMRDDYLVSDMGELDSLAEQNYELKADWAPDSPLPVAEHRTESESNPG